MELSPGYAMAHQGYGVWLCLYGQPEQGLAEIALALDLNPLSPVVSDSLGLALLHLERVSEAESRSRQILDLHPDFWRVRVTLACVALGAATSELVQVWAAGGWGTEPRDAP